MQYRFSSLLRILWLVAIIMSSQVSAVATNPVLVGSATRWGSYPIKGPAADPQEDIMLANQGYTLTKVEVSKTAQNQMDGFQLYFTPNAGGADIIQRFGFFCTTNLVAVAITKPVVAVTGAGTEPNVGFIFHHPDGTTTETATIAGRTTSDEKMDLCGNFIGMKCSFHKGCSTTRRVLDEEIKEIFRGRQLPPGQPDGTNGCMMYYDGGDLNLEFTQTIPNVSLQVGDSGITTTAWETSHTQNSSCGGTETQSSSISYQKNGVVLGAIPSFLTYNSAAQTFSIASQADPTNVGTYTVAISATVTIGSVSSTATSSFTITITSDCEATTIIAPTLATMSVNVSQSATQDVTFADTKGSLHPDQSWCGARTYIVSSTPAASFLSVTGTTFSANPTLLSDTGQYSVTLTVGLALFSSVAKANQTFIVNVACSVLSLSFTTAPATSTTITLGITNQPQQLSFAVSKIPNCAQSVTFALSPPSGFVSSTVIDASSGEIKINGATISNQRSTPYSFSLSAGVDSATASTQFDVVITDPCSTATFSIDPIASLNAYIPGTSILEQIYVIKNGVTSLHSTIVCNNSPVTLTPSASYLTYDSTKIYVDRAKLSTSDVGTHTFTMSVNSLEYSSTATSGTQTVTVIVSVKIDCTTVQINKSPSIIQAVTYSIQVSSPNVQSFAPSTYLNSDVTLIPYSISQCGKFTYLTTEFFKSFIQITPPSSGLTFQDNFTLTVDTQKLTLVGDHNVSILVALASDPTIYDTISFLVTFTCDVQSLSFTTAPPVSTTITLGVTPQPVSVPFVVAKTPNCAQSVTFVLSPSGGFVSLTDITDGTGLILINGATILNHSDTPYSFSLKSTLNSHKAEVSFNVVITDPCSTAYFSIDPIPIIFAQLPSSNKLQQNYKVKNSITSVYQSITCNNSLVSITPSASFISIDSENIYVDLSKLTTASLGTLYFTLTVNSLEYASPTTTGTQSVTINVTYVVDCTATKINTSASILSPVTYTIQKSGPDVQSFAPSSYLNDDPILIPLSISQCGSFTYSVSEPFVKITPPVSGLTFQDNYTFTVDTLDLTLTGNRNISIKVFLTNYPTVQATIPVQVTLIHPCQTTRLIPLSLSDMKFQIQSQPTAQEFNQIIDIFGYTSNQPDICGDRTYSLDKQYPFLSVGLSDSGQQKMKIQLATNDISLVGNYTTRIVVGLKDYPKVTPISLSFKCTISKPPKNNLPYFETPLPASIEVTITEQSTQWKYRLPRILDLDNDQVKLSVQLGTSSLFVQFDSSANVFIIPDIKVNAAEPFKPGLYPWQIKLDDSHDVVSFTIMLTVSLPPGLQPVQATNSTQTNSTDITEQTSLPEELVEQIKLWREELIEKKATAKPVNWNLIPPNPFKRRFTQFGKLTIGFSFPIYVAPNITMINNGTISLSQLHYKTQATEGRRMQDLADDQIPILEVSLVPGPESNATELGFSWNLTSEKEDELTIQLTFENPTAVSSNPIPDSLHVKFNDLLAFLGKNGLEMEANSSLMKLYIPAQTRSSKVDLTIANTLESITSFSNAVVQSNFVLTIFVSGSLNQLWSLVNTQQIILLMALACVSYPANAAAFLAQMQSIAAFDYIDMSPYINTLLKLNDTDSFSSGFEHMGYGSMYFSNNLGTLNLAFLFYFGALPAMKYFKYQQNSSRKMMHRYLKLKRLIIHTYPITTVLESYASMAVSSFISLSYIRWGSWGETFQTVYGFMFDCILFLFPFWLIVLKKRWIDVRNDHGKTSKYAAFYSDLSIKKGPRVLLWPVFYLVRRLMLASIMVFSSETFIFQLMVMAYHVVFSIILLGYIEPFDTRSQQRIEMLNEVCLLFVIYPIICFSPFMTNSQRKYEMGYICCAIIVFNLLFNLTLMLHSNAVKLIRELKLRHFKKFLMKQHKLTMARRDSILTIRRALSRQITENQASRLKTLNSQKITRCKKDLAYLEAFGVQKCNQMAAERKKQRAEKQERRLQAFQNQRSEQQRSLFVIEEEPGEVAIESEQHYEQVEELDQNSQRELLELENQHCRMETASFELREQQNDKQKVHINILTSLTRNDSNAIIERMAKPEYFLVWTSDGPVKCKRRP